MAISSNSLGNSVPNDFLVVLKALLLIPQDKTLVGGTGAPVLIVAWSLQYEMFFYLCFIIMILSRWLSIIIGFLLLYVYVKYSEVPTTYLFITFLTKDYILLFFLGMAISLACNSEEIIFSKPMFYLVFGLVLFSIVALDVVLQNNLFNEGRTKLYGLASSLTIVGLVKLEDNGVVIGSHKWIQLLGDSSYALYLIHFPLISILCKLFIFLHFNAIGFLGAFSSYILTFIACIISSVLFHLSIEKPLGKFLKNPRIS